MLGSLNSNCGFSSFEISPVVLLKDLSLGFEPIL